MDRAEQAAKRAGLYDSGQDKDQPNINDAIHEVGKQRRIELKENLIKWREKDSRARLALTELELSEADLNTSYERGEVVTASGRDRLIDDIKQLQIENETLKLRKEELEITIEDIKIRQNDNSMRQSLIRNDRSELARQVKVMSAKNKKRGDHYWELFGAQQVIEDELKAVDAEMEQLRFENSQLSEETSQLEVLA